MAEQFVMTSYNALRNIKNAYELNIYILLKKNVNVAGFCSLSYSKIAELLNISRSKAICAINSLAEQGLIKKEVIVANNGCHKINHYYLLDVVSFWKSTTSEKKEILNKYSSFQLQYDESQTGQFLMVYHSVIDANMTPRERSVYLSLLRFKGQDGACFPSLATLAKSSGMCIRTVYKCINSLLEKKLIRKNYITYKSSKWKKCVYRFLHISKNKYNVKKTANENIDKNDSHFNTKKRKQQKLTWTKEEVYDYFNYADCLLFAGDKNIKFELVDICFDVLFEVLSAGPNETFNYKGDKKPISILQSMYQKLEPYDIIYALEQYSGKKKPINKNPINYLKVLLYTSRNQRLLEIENGVNSLQEDLYSE